ncbi:MAG: alpha/beta hydrolase [Pseudomonadota bacterium]
MPDPLQQNFEDFIARSVAQPGTSHHVQVDGVSLHYLEWQGPPGAPTLLLLHGYLAHAHWWDFVAPWLATQYRIIAPDFSGMGDSGQRPTYSYPLFHAEINGLVEALGIGGCIVIGHSFGGRALLYACAARPDLYARAIVVDSRLGTPSDPLRGFDEEWRPKKRYAEEQDVLKRFVLKPIEPAPDAAMRHLGRMSIRHEPGGWTWKFDENVTRMFQQRGDGPGVDDRAVLAGLPTPVDFIYGEESRVVTPSRAADLTSCLPKVLSVIGIPGAHHHLPISQPVALIAALRVLLGRKTG